MKVSLNSKLPLSLSWEKGFLKEEQHLIMMIE